jgi:hypothetical protein
MAINAIWYQHLDSNDPIKDPENIASRRNAAIVPLRWYLLSRHQPPRREPP